MLILGALLGDSPKFYRVLLFIKEETKNSITQEYTLRDFFPEECQQMWT